MPQARLSRAGADGILVECLLPGARPEKWCEDCRDCPHNFEPNCTLEISNCYKRIALEFDFETQAERQNSLHKLDTFIAALRVFRARVEVEQAECERRERELVEHKGE